MQRWLGEVTVMIASTLCDCIDVIVLNVFPTLQ